MEATLGLTQSSPLVPAEVGGGGVEATLGLTQSSPLVPVEGECGGDSRPHSVQSTRPCGKGGVEATLGLTQSSALVPARDGVCVEATLGLTQSSPLVPTKGVCEGDSRPHSVQSTHPCGGGGVWRRLSASLSPVHSSLWRWGVEATFGLTQSCPIVPAERGVWR